MKEMLKPKMIRDHLCIFINALIVNPVRTLSIWLDAISLSFAPSQPQWLEYHDIWCSEPCHWIEWMLSNLMIVHWLTVYDQAFSSQTKEVLTTKSSAFGSTCTVPEATMKSLSNKIKAKIKEFLSFKLEQSASKTDGKRYIAVRYIENQFIKYCCYRTLSDLCGELIH